MRWLRPGEVVMVGAMIALPTIVMFGRAGLFHGSPTLGVLSLAGALLAIAVGATWEYRTGRLPKRSEMARGFEVKLNTGMAPIDATAEAKGNDVIAGRGEARK